MKVLEEGYHDKCALSLFFFSDGRSTDHDLVGISQAKAVHLMKEKITSMATRFVDALTISMVGLGNTYDDFSAMEAMADAATRGGAKASFERCSKVAHSISSAVSSLVTSTTETRTALQEGLKAGFTTRTDLVSEKDAAVKFDWRYYTIVAHHVYYPETNRVWPTNLLPLAAVQSNAQEARRRHFDPPKYLAINTKYVGKGVERVAYRSRLSDNENVQGFTFEPMVAKETKDVERIQEHEEFHFAFLHTQNLAAFLAQEFNKLLPALADYDRMKTPRIQFLDSSILIVEDKYWPGGKRGVLVEKMLDTERFPWTKWNDNNGMVDGRIQHRAINVDFELKELQKEKDHKLALGAITEEEEEESDEEASISDVESEDDGTEGGDDPDWNTQASSIRPSDYLQAFTHFTYLYTNRQVLVCDLQGVFNTDLVPPTFELTDPAIHYRSTRGRRMVHGRTDKGASGMKSFFRSHKCTNICKFLKLSGKNKKWKQNYRRKRQSSNNAATKEE